jgi:hypothetical protein
LAYRFAIVGRRTPEASTGCRWGKPAPQRATDISQGREVTPEWGPKNEAPVRAYSGVR